MNKSLDIFQTASAMAKHAGVRQAMVARNIANADTPAYRAHDIAAFRETYKAHAAEQPLRMTRPGHLASSEGAFAAQIIETGGEPAPNGNTVSLEEELMNSVQISRDHSTALAIYQHAMTVMRTSLGKP